MAVPAAVLSVLVQANTGGATRGLMRFNQQLGGTEAQSNKATRALGTFAKVGVIGAGIGLGYAVKKAADFEQQLDSLGSVSGATGREMERFRKQAMKAGADTKFSALDAAEAQTELAKGGLRVKQIMRGGLRAALALAAAGEMDLGDAAATTANALNLFGLEGKNSMKVADALAKAANATTADVTDFAMALKQGGGVAHQAGLSFTETVLQLEALAKSGVKNSDAGTSMKTAFLQLIGPTEKQMGLAKQLNLEFIDQHGNMKNLSDISKMLRDRLGDMGNAQRVATLKALAGTDGVRTLLSLYQAGPKQLDRWRKGLDESGTAAVVAARKQDNLKGKLENLQGSVETIAISIGSKLLPQLTEYAEKLTDILNNTKLSSSEKVGKVAELLAEAIGKGIGAAGAAAAKAAPHVASAFVRAFMDADAWGKLAIGGAGAFLLRKLGVGSGIGKLLGRGGGGGLTGGAGGILKSTKPIPVFVTNPGGVGGGTAAVGGAAKGGAAALAAGVGAAIGPALAGAIAAEVGRELRKELDKQTKKLPGGKALTDTRNFIGRNIPAGMPGGPFLQSVFGNKLEPKKLKSGVGETFKGVATATADAQKLIKATQHVRRAFGEMRSGTVTDVRQISKIANNNFRKIREDIGLNTKAGRQAAERNFEAAATAIGKSMAKGRVSSKKGMSAIEDLMRTHSKVGKERLTQNLIAAANNIKRSMDSGRTATKKGTEAIEALMVRALQNMGFSKKQALKFQKADTVKGVLGATPRTPGFKRGGPIMEGAMSGDSVPSVLERGEYVLNRNAVRKVGKKTLDNINFSAAPRFASGGMVRVPGDPDDTGGRDKVNSSVVDLAAFLVKLGNMNIGYAFDPGGGHKSPGHNITGTAMDVYPAGNDPGWSRLETAIRWATNRGMTVYYDGQAGSTPLADHGEGNHAHFELATGHPGSKFPKVGNFDIGPAEKIARMVVDGPDSLLKADVQGALDVARAGAQKVVNSQAGQAPVSGKDAGMLAGFSGGGNAAKNRALGKQMAAAFGWKGEQWNALDKLWTGESGWINQMNQAGSGATGIPQALPGSKMASEGADWATNVATQIRWGLKYIKGTYGSPVNAYNTWLSRSPHWYKKGGMIGKLAYAGDSLGVGTLGAGLKGKLGKIDLASKAEVGKTSSWGVDQLREMMSKSVGAGMLDMGTNDGTAGNLRPSIAAVEKMLQGRPLVMSTLDPQSTDVAHKNAAIKSKADVVVPWADMAQKYASDKVHPTGAGYSKRAQMIAAAVKKIRGKDGEEDLPKRLTKTLKHGPLKKAFGKTLKFLRKEDSKKQRSKALRMFERRIKKVSGSIPDGLRKQIGNLTNDAAIYDEYATRAGSLTGDEEGAAPGVAKGRTEAQWLQAELMKLFLLRNKLVEAEKIIEKRRKQIADLLDAARKRLKKLAENIKAGAVSKKHAEKVLKQLQKHPKENRDKIKKQKAFVKRIDEGQAERVRERTGLEKNIIPALRGKRSGLSTAMGDLNEPLTTVQGLGAPMGRLKGLPALGVMGGQIFDVQMRLRDLAAPKTPITDGSEAEPSQSAELLAQLLREANLRTAVSEKQFEVFKNFPAYGGQFATGGVVPGPIGEARTIIAHGGETVTPPGNGGGANVQVIVGPGMEWLEKFIEVKVDGVTRKQARNANRMLPGRGGGV